LAKRETATLTPKRRHSLRVRLDNPLPAAIIGKRRGTALVRDLALRGAFLETEYRAAVGESLQIEIFAGADSIRPMAAVRNVTPLGIGVEFVNLDSGEHQQLRRLITSLLE
jgi:PilZ domain